MVRVDGSVLPGRKVGVPGVAGWKADARFLSPVTEGPREEHWCFVSGKGKQVPAVFVAPEGEQLRPCPVDTSVAFPGNDSVLR